MKGLLQKELIVYSKTRLLIMIAMMLLCIGLLFVSSKMIETADESSSDLPPEQYKQFIGTFCAFIGFALIFTLGGREKTKSDTLLCTLPLSEKDIAIAFYSAALVQHLAGIITAAIYFTAGYFIGLFQNPLHDYLSIGVTIFFLGWLSELLLLPLSVSEFKQWQITAVEAFVLLIPIGAIFIFMQLGVENLFKVTDWFKDNSLLIMLCTIVVACACTPFSIRLAMKQLRKERI